jgi:hypothetical protein
MIMSCFSLQSELSRILLQATVLYAALVSFAVFVSPQLFFIAATAFYSDCSVFSSRSLMYTCYLMKANCYQSRSSIPLQRLPAVVLSALL